MSFIIDDFHSSGHTGTYCKEHCLPSLEENRALLGAFPTSIAESVNSQFSPLGHKVHHMNKFFAQLFIHECADVHNISKLLHLRDKKRANAKKRKTGPDV